MEQEKKLEGMVVEDICNCCGKNEVCECEVEDHEEDEEYEVYEEICGEVDV